MSPTALVLSLPVAFAGLFYLVNPGGTGGAGGVTGNGATRAERVRGRLRRTNGLVLVLTGVVLYLAVSRTFPLPAEGGVGVLAPVAWITLFPLTFAMVLLAVVDLRLTRAMKKELARRAMVESARRQAVEEKEKLWAAEEARKWAEQAERAAGGGKLVVVAALLAGTLLAGAGCERAAVQAPPSPAPPVQSAPATSPAAAPEPPADPEPGRDVRAQALPRVPMRVGDTTLWAQVAADEHTREVGLMFRKTLGDDEAMLFVFPDSDARNFWMRNTFVPLDIVYLDARRRVLNVAQMIPRDERGTPSAGAAMYALELPLNKARALGIKPGQVIELPAR